MMRFAVLLLLLSILSTLEVFSQSANVMAGEYFVDDYRDFGEGEPISITPGETVNFSTTLNLNAFLPGIHRLYVRVKNNDGIWSQTYSRLFLQPDYDSASIAGFEYFFDNYVDFGQGTFVTLEEDSSEYPIRVSDDLTPGVHLLYTRARSSDNEWSHTVRRLFLVPDSTEVTNIARLEYYFTDADGSNATQRFIYDDFDPAPSVVLRDEGFNASLLEASKTYLLHVQAFTEDGEGTAERTEEFTLTIPETTLNTSITTENCLGTANLTVTGGEGDYTYSISTDSANYATGNSFPNLSPGEYIAYAQQDGIVLVDTFFIVALPELLLTEIGNPIRPTCDNPDGGGFTVAASGGAEEGYEYSIQGRGPQENGMFSGLTAGSYTVTATDVNGCELTMEVVVPTSEGAPETPVITIQQNATADSLSTEVILTVENVSGMFTWYLDGEVIDGETSNQITLANAGNYTVKVKNAADCESAQSNDFSVTAISDLPEQMLLVYPNPVGEELHIVLPTMGKVTSIQLFDLQGRVILNHRVLNKRMTTLPTHTLKPGTYLVRITDGNQLIQQKIQKY